jgi:hypothetical protein
MRDTPTASYDLGFDHWQEASDLAWFDMEKLPETLRIRPAGTQELFGRSYAHVAQRRKPVAFDLPDLS